MHCITHNDVGLLTFWPRLEGRETGGDDSFLVLLTAADERSGRWSGKEVDCSSSVLSLCFFNSLGNGESGCTCVCHVM